MIIAHPPDKKRRLEKRERKRRQSVDGGSTWLFSAGERGEHDRRIFDEEQASIIHLPHVEENPDAIPGAIPGAIDEKTAAVEKTSNPIQSPAPAIAINNTSDVHNTNSETNLSKVNGAITINADSPTSIPLTKSNDNGKIESLPHAASYPVNETESLDTTVSEDDQTDGTLTEQEQARLHSLKAMLNASNARYKKATRNRRPKFSAGLEILIVSGDHEGKIGVVLDADYIANRALISLSDQESPHWIAFRFLGHAD